MSVVLRPGPSDAGARRARDALAILASLLLRHGRPDVAATLLAALAHLPGDRAWAARNRARALLEAGRDDEAAAEARDALAAGGMSDAARSVLLGLLARAEWRRGRRVEARAVFAEALALARAGIVPRDPIR